MSERIWVITGTSSGFGLAIAKYVLLQGDKVIATVRSLPKFPVSLRDGGAQPLILDLNDSDEGIKAAAIRAIQIYGRVDVLINNAGTNSAVGPVEEVQMDSIRRQFQENVFGTLAFTQPFIEHFRTRRSGHIINVSSMASFMNPPSGGAYAASKSALASFSDSLSREVALFGVRVHAIHPGYFPTSIFTSHPNYTSSGAGVEDIPVAAGLSKVYTDQSQGYNLVNIMPRMHEALGYVGDPDTVARRVYEIVTDTGMAKDLKLNEKPWTGIPMGSDSGEGILGKMEDFVEICRAVEPIWRSTDSARRAKL
ncbi:NAD-P-binding protein [Cytidiella melzeri]|nr:NAD-P-binding protein [Cytidiella melzeri]